MRLKIKNMTFSKVSLSVAVLVLLVVFGLAGCGGGGGGGGGENVNVSDPNAPPSSLAIGSITTMSSSVTIPATDTKVEIPGYLSVNLPSGSIQKAETVTVSLTNTTETAFKFDVTSEIFQVRGRQSYEHRVNIGKTAPLTDYYSVTITLPNDFITKLQPTDTIVTFAQLETVDIVLFDAIESTYDTNNKTISINLASEYFSKFMTVDGTYEAVIVVSVVNSGPTGATASANAKRSALGFPDWSYKEGINSPLKQLHVTQDYHDQPKPPHKGVDLRAVLTPATPVIAAADGKIYGRAERVSYNPIGPIRNKGYGYYALIRHPDNSTTLYAHLQSAPPDGPATKGQIFATSGNSGNVDAHLHFEIITPEIIPDVKLPNLNIAAKRVNPWPWIQSLVYVTGDQNGAEEPSHFMQISDPPLQLKAIGLASASGVKYNITEDSHRNAISVEDITWESSDENIATVDNKGLVTAKKNGNVTITATQSSSNSTGKSVSVIVTTTTGTAPSTPTGASATAGNGQITISWNAVTGATSYNIYWSTTSGVTKTSGTKISNATSPYTHTGRTNGTTYYYIVTAVNSSGESMASSQASATTNGTGGVSYTW